MGLLRSLLLVPASQPQRMEEAPLHGADALILDLEGPVSASEKADARKNVVSYLQRGSQLPVLVRIHGWDTLEVATDLLEIVHLGLAGVFLPRVESAAQVKETDYLLSSLEMKRGLQVGSIGILVALESAKGVLLGYELLTASSRVSSVVFGGAQQGTLARELGGNGSHESLGLGYARAKTLLDARAAGIQFLLDGPFTDVEDGEGLVQDTRFSKELGYTGRVALHPRQVPIINELFATAAQEVSRRDGHPDLKGVTGG